MKIKFVISKLSDRHDRESFDSGDPELNIFLQKQATQYIKRGLCSVYVLMDSNLIIGYYSLSPSSISPTELPIEIMARYPRHPIPCWLLGRFAIDSRYQKQGIGGILLVEIFKKVLVLSKEAGGYCILVNAKNENVKNFYKKYGFISFKDNELNLFLPLKSIDTTLF
jgi:GNAT superfamily N-acetyltransferase